MCVGGGGGVGGERPGGGGGVARLCLCGGACVCVDAGGVEEEEG